MYFKNIDVLHKEKDIYILYDFRDYFKFLSFVLRIQGRLLNEKHIKTAWPRPVPIGAVYGPSMLK